MPIFCIFCCFSGRPPLSSGIKLAITLRFLATGNSYRSLAFDFRVAHNTISLFVPEVCRAITEEYQDEVFSTPSTPDEWREVADAFRDRWNYPHCCGAIDGKHVAIIKPSKSGTLYFNYKGFFSIVVLAVADAQYKFLWAKIGATGSYSDSGIFNRCSLEPALSYGTIGFPDPDQLPNNDQNTPYFLVGDDAFPLRTYMMKPYSKRQCGARPAPVRRPSDAGRAPSDGRHPSPVRRPVRHREVGRAPARRPSGARLKYTTPKF